MKSTYKPTAGESKKLDEDKTIKALQVNLQNGLDNPFKSFEGDYFRNVDVEYLTDGSVEVTAEIQRDHPTKKGKRIIEPVVILVDPEDVASVNDAYQYFSKPKNKATVAVKESEKKGEKKPKGALDLID